MEMISLKLIVASMVTREQTRSSHITFSTPLQLSLNTLLVPHCLIMFTERERDTDVDFIDWVDVNTE